jgi:hypothetical protein
MLAMKRRTGPAAKLLAAAVAATLMAGCSTPAPKPAMVPLGQTGDFGYSERDVGTDRIEVTYTGANLRVSSSQGKNDSRMVAERAKTRDLAIWRAAQIADQRGMAAMRIENETRDSNVNVTQQYVQHYSPFYDPFWPRRHFCCGPFYDDDPFYYQPVRRASAQSVSTLTVLLLKQYDPHDTTQLPVKDTLTKLQTARSGAVY